MAIYDTRCTKCKFEGEIEKSIHAALPRCPECGAQLRRVYHPTAVVYAATGFSATDGRLEKMVGHERYARFDAQRKDAESRARNGRLTAYEQALEAIE